MSLYRVLFLYINKPILILITTVEGTDRLRLTSLHYTANSAVLVSSLSYKGLGWETALDSVFCNLWGLTFPALCHQVNHSKPSGNPSPCPSSKGQ